MEKQKIEVKTHLPYKDAVSYIEDFLKSLKSGTIVVENGTDHVELSPAESVSIEVVAKAKKGKQKFSFEVEWTEPSCDSLNISDQKPIPMGQGTTPPAPKPQSAPVPKTAAKTPAKKTACKSAAKKMAPKKSTAKSKPSAAAKTASKK